MVDIDTSHDWDENNLHCINCHRNYELAQAIRREWYDSELDSWLSPMHQLYVSLRDKYCPSKTDPTIYKSVLAQCVDLERHIAVWVPESTTA